MQKEYQNNEYEDSYEEEDVQNNNIPRDEDAQLNSEDEDWENQDIKFVNEENGELEEDEEEEAESIDEKQQRKLQLEQKILESDTTLLRSKIDEILTVLQDYKQNNPYPEKTISDYRIELRNLYARYFSYSMELMEYIMSLFNVHECFNFLEMMELQRPLTIRVNTLKSKKRELAQKLMEKGVQLEPLDEISKVCLKINQSKIPIGASTEYLAGFYMVQSAASLLPVMALGPEPGDYVLDMSAAPGGKTTHIGQLMKNQGLIVANDIKKERLVGLHYNCQRLGIQNVIVTNYDGRKFPQSLKNFDKILLDAPCTGLGIISRDPSIKSQRTVKDIYRAAHLQKELLRAAIDRCKVGGYVVYSTCSIAVEENEMVVDYVVKNRFVKVVDTGLKLEDKVYTKFKDQRFHDRIKYCVRVFPHVHNLDGFFVAKLQKLRDGEKTAENEQIVPQKKKKKIKKKKASKNVNTPLKNNTNQFQTQI